MNVMDSDVFYDTYIKKDFETQYVPQIFEKICKQFLIRLNKAGKTIIPFFKIGKYDYDDPVNKKNGEFDVVTEDSEGYIFYECKYRNTKISQHLIENEIEQVKQTGMNCYKYGFFSKCGFDPIKHDDVILYSLDDLFSDL